MDTFDFRSSSGDAVDPAKWVEAWSLKFDSQKYPEDCYEELVRNGMNLSDADFDVLGAWKDGGIIKAKPGIILRLRRDLHSLHGKSSPFLSPAHSL